MYEQYIEGGGGAVGVGWNLSTLADWGEYHNCLWGGESGVHWGYYMEYIVQNNVFWFSQMY